MAFRMFNKDELFYIDMFSLLKVIYSAQPIVSKINPKKPGIMSLFAMLEF